MPPTFDHRKFFAGHRSRFGPLPQDLVDAIETLLGEIERDNRFARTESDRRQLAYCLATFKWETAHTLSPIDERGSAKQLTGRRNYSKAKALTGVDLLSQPDRAKEPALAYEIAVQGMKDGWFTSRKLDQFIKNDVAVYENARPIINGHDKAQTIADMKRRFSEALLPALQ